MRETGSRSSSSASWGARLQLALSKAGLDGCDVDLAVQAGMRVVLLRACIRHLRTEDRRVAEAVGCSPSLAIVFVAVMAGVVPLMFTLGEKGAGAWTLSRFDRIRACDIHRTRTIDEMAPLAAWKPGIACLCVSLPAGAWAVVVFRKSIVPGTHA